MGIIVGILAWRRVCVTTSHCIVIACLVAKHINGVMHDLERALDNSDMSVVVNTALLDIVGILFRHRQLRCIEDRLVQWLDEQPITDLGREEAAYV
jgi:hypothetical protein